jgi:hypothetical protein
MQKELVDKYREMSNKEFLSVIKENPEVIEYFINNNPDIIFKHSPKLLLGKRDIWLAKQHPKWCFENNCDNVGINILFRYNLKWLMDNHTEVISTNSNYNTLDSMVDKYPEWLSINRPKWCYDNYKELMYKHNLKWLIDNRFHETFEENPELVFEHKPTYVAEQYPEWCKTKYPHLYKDGMLKHSD